MSLRFSDYLAAAFSWRPLGMPVSPNWLGLAGFALAGLLNPGFWLLGAGLELAWLYTLTHNGRFRALVERAHAPDPQQGLDQRLASLDELGRARLQRLRRQCEELLPEQGDDDALSDALGHLLAAAFDLHQTRVRIEEAMAGWPEPLPMLVRRRAALDTQLGGERLDEALRRSLESQAELLDRRIEAARAATDRLAVIEAELQRIDDQVALQRDMALLEADPTSTAQRVDRISSSLASTQAWLSEHRELYGLEPQPSDTPIPLRRAPQGQRS